MQMEKTNQNIHSDLIIAVIIIYGLAEQEDAHHTRNI